MKNSSNRPSSRPGSGLRRLALNALVGLSLAIVPGCTKTPAETCADNAAKFADKVKNVQGQLAPIVIPGVGWEIAGPDKADALQALLEAKALYGKVVTKDASGNPTACFPDAGGTLKEKMAHDFQSVQAQYEGTP